MRVAISTARQAHYSLAANAFTRHGEDVTVYTTTPRGRMRGFETTVKTRWIPAPVTIASGLFHSRTPLILDEFDSVLFDRWAAASLEECQLLVGAASSSLATGVAAQRRGATFVLDRACPDIRVQQNILIEEARKVGGVFRANSPWFVDRQVEEYERADFILSPSKYSLRSFPKVLQPKVILAPLCGRAPTSTRLPKQNQAEFVLGVVGNDALRKGYLYLLQAWKELALPRSQLKIRSGGRFNQFPVLAKLLHEQPTVRILRYVPDISDFYNQCDAFILPSIDDGFGMALFEALANGVPSIATRNCGASELLTDGHDCLIIEAFNVSQIKDAILRLYESCELRTQLEVNGPATIKSLHQDGFARPYEEGIGRLMQEINATRHLA